MLIWLWLFWQDPKPIEIQVFGKFGAWELPNCEDRTIPAENALKLSEGYTELPGAEVTIQFHGSACPITRVADAKGIASFAIPQDQEFESVRVSMAGMRSVILNGQKLAAMNNVVTLSPEETIILNCRGPWNGDVPLLAGCNLPLFSEAFDGNWSVVLDPTHLEEAVTERNSEQETLLMFAAANSGPLQELINSGADLFATNQSGFNSLFYAVFGQNTRGLDGLLRAGIPIDMATEDGETALMFAAKFGLKEMVIFLLTRGADLRAEDEHGFTAMDFALSTQQFRMAEYLWDRGCPYSQDTFEMSLNGANISLVRKLWKAGACEKENLYKFLTIRDPAIIRFVLEVGQDTLKVDDCERAFQSAAEMGDDQIIPIWLKFAASHPLNLHLDLALQKALTSCQLESAKLLLAAGANPGLEIEGELPIEVAMYNSCPEVVAYWLKERLPFPEDIDREDIFEFPNEVLREAILEKQDWRVKSALKSGAQLNQPDDDCLHPLDLAIVRRYPFAIRTLYEHGGTSLLRPNLSLSQLLEQFRPQAENEITLYDIMP